MPVVHTRTDGVIRVETTDVDIRPTKPLVALCISTVSAVGGPDKTPLPGPPQHAPARRRWLCRSLHDANGMWTSARQPTRMSVNPNGEHRTHPLESSARDVDICRYGRLQTLCIRTVSTTARGRKNPVETLCNRTVSANTGATGRTSPDVNIPPATPVETLCLSTVSARAKTAETRASRATAALEVRHSAQPPASHARHRLSHRAR